MFHVEHFGCMTKKNSYITVKDHSVSGEMFDLFHDEELDLLKTIPQPSKTDLPKYYESEDYISHTDSKRNIFEFVYHQVRRFALRKKLNLINSFKTSERQLLDIGCGTGDFLELANSDDWIVTGIEPNENARRIANVKTNNAVFDIDQLPQLSSQSFDVITLWHVLEHLPDLEGHIQLVQSLLKPNGRVIIAVPNYKSFDAKHYGSFWAAYDVPRHLWHFSKDAISNLFQKVGMEIQDIKPMLFDAYYVSLLSEKYKRGSMNPLFGFWNGWRSNVKAKRTGEYSSLIYILKKT